MLLLFALALVAGIALALLKRDAVQGWLQARAPGQQPWAAGACRSYAPTGSPLHRTIVVDPGHGSPDPGTDGVTSAGKRVYEKDLTLSTALLLLPRLRADGYEVVLTRSSDMSVAKLAAADVQDGALTVAADHRDLVARVACANASHAQLFVSIHFNAFNQPGVAGVETFYDDARTFTADNARLAGLVQSGIVGALSAAGLAEPDRGTAPDSTDAAPTLSAAAAAYNHLLVLGPAQPGYLDAPSAMPGALTEPLFLTNLRDATIAAGAAGQEAIARGIEEGIQRYFAGSAGT